MVKHFIQYGTKVHERLSTLFATLCCQLFMQQTAHHAYHLLSAL